MPEIIQEWLGTRLGVILDMTPNIFGRNTKDGTLLAKLLYSYGVIPLSVLEKISETKNYYEAYKNLTLLKPWLDYIGVTYDEAMLKGMAGGEGSAAISIFYAAYLNLEGKDRWFYLSLQKERKFSGDSYLNKFKVDWVPEKTLKEETKNVWSHLTLPLIEKRHVVDIHKAKCEEVRKVIKKTKEKFEKTINRKSQLGPVISKHVTSTPLNKNLIEAEETEKKINAFEKKHVQECPNLTYSELIELKNIQDAKPEMIIPDLKEAQNIVSNIKWRKKKEIFTKNFHLKMQHTVLDEQWKQIMENQEVDFENTVCANLLKQSQYEKQMAGKLALIRNQKKILMENRKKIECLKIHQSDKDFDDLIKNRLEERGEYWEEREFEKERIEELHRRLYNEKAKVRKANIITECSKIVDAFVDIAIRIAETRILTACHVPKSFMKDLKELFFKDLSIFDILDNFEEVCKADYEENLMVKNLSGEEGETCYFDFDYERQKNAERERQSILDECDFNDYLHLLGPWMVELLFPDGSEVEVDQVILGYIVHKLLVLKYPRPNLAAPADIKPMKPTVVVLGINDPIACQMLTDLMETCKILVVIVEDAINFILNAYKSEMSAVKDFDSNFQKATLEAFSDETEKPLSTSEKKKKKKKLLKTEENIQPWTEEIFDSNDKQTQTPRVLPEENSLLSRNADMGRMAFEALGRGDPVPDPIIASAIAAYVISKQENYDGWLLLNYPLLYSQASYVECVLTGYRILPIVDDMERLEDVEDFNFREDCVDPLEMDVDADKRVSRLLPNPIHTPVAMPSQVKLPTSYFDSFINLKKKTEYSQTLNTFLEDTPMLNYYTNQNLLFNFEYENLNFETVKNLGKSILNENPPGVVSKNSEEIFGTIILDLNEKWGPKNKKKGKAKSPASKKRIPPSTPVAEVKTKELFSKELSDEVIQKKKKNQESPPTTAKPGDLNWEWATGELPDTVSLALATFWENVEAIYINDFKNIFFSLRVHRSNVLSYSSFISKWVKNVMKSPDEKQKVLSDFQYMFNEIDVDLRPDVDIKNELHVRVSELEEALMGIADERKKNALHDLQKVTQDGWVADEMIDLVNAYLSALQLEADRCVDTCQMIMDYYISLQQKIPNEVPLAKINIPKLQIDKNKSTLSSLNKSSIISSKVSDVKWSGKEVPSSKSVNERASKTRSLTEKKRRISEVNLSGATEAINEILANRFLPEDYLTPFHTYFLENGQVDANEVKNVVESCMSEVKRNIAPPKNQRKTSDSKVIANVGLYQEWLSALENELDRFLFRTKLILARGIYEMNEFLTTILNILSSLVEDVNDMYLKEIHSISECCKVFRCGIEEEIKIIPLLELKNEEFTVNDDYLVYRDEKNIKDSLLLEDDNMKYRFSFEQLSIIVQKLQKVSPSGEIVKKALLFILQDLNSVNSAVELFSVFPAIWSVAKPEDMVYILDEVYQDLEIVHWKDFIIYAMDLSVPTEDEILLMRQRFRNYDPNVTELISRENYWHVNFWFESTLNHYIEVDRKEKAKDLLFRLYQVNEEQTNYSALLLAFCKDENPVIGFVKALALVMGVKINLKDFSDDYWSIFGEEDGPISVYENTETSSTSSVGKLNCCDKNEEAIRKCIPKDKIRKCTCKYFKKSTTSKEEEEQTSTDVENNSLMQSERQGELYFDLKYSDTSSTVSSIPHHILSSLLKASYPSLPQLSILLNCRHTFEESINFIYSNFKSPDDSIGVKELLHNQFISELLKKTNKFKSVLKELQGGRDRLMAAKMPERSYTCEICGMEGLSEESMREHTVSFHLEGAASCPFCDFCEVSPDELLIHVNTAHLDYLTPEDELFDFIDDEKFGGTSKPLEPDPEIIQSAKNINVNNNYINNINNNNNNNNNNENAVPTSSRTGAEGSPLRTQLNLNLRGNNAPSVVKRQQCMMCGFSSISPLELEEHINRQHFDLTSPTGFSSTPNSPKEDFRCPLCVRSFRNIKDLELHVNMEHRDILSPAKSSTPGSIDNWSEGCPVCLRSNFKNNQEMVAHIEEHFNNGTPATPDLTSDGMLAKEIDKREKETRKQREQKEFEMLQAQYGMDNQGNFKEQSFANMQKAVFAGEMSVSDFYERQVELRFAENNGIDDGSSCTKDLIPKIIAVSHLTPNIARVFTCTTVDHYASTYGDKGWGCGYRNLQMLISSLLYHTGYNDQLYKPSLVGGGLYSINNGILSRSATPSISKLQQHIEWAWREGFDVQGSDQLGGKLHNTRKWIGATEVVTVLSSLRIRCQLIDFDRPTSPDGSHPELFNWVLKYFQKYEDFKPPLYLQHQGHSRTIVGIEQYKDGHLILLVFDPSHTPEQMSQFKNTATALLGMRLIRRTLSAMKARQYQVVAVRGIMDTEREYQQSKLLRSTRIPQDP